MATHCMYFHDACTVDMKERCLLCGGSQSTVKTSHWVCEKWLAITMCIYHYYMPILYRSNVTGVMDGSVLTVMT